MKLDNQRYYGNAGALGANYFETLTDVNGWVGPNEWRIISIGMVCTDAKNYLADKANLLKLCSTCNCCTKEDINQINSISTKVQNSVASPY